MRSQEQLDERIASLRRQQWTYRDIALATGTGRSRIADVILDRRLAPNRQGRPPKVTDAIRDRIIGLTYDNCKLSDQQISTLTSIAMRESISRNTVNRIRHSFDFQPTSPKVCQQLSADQLNARRQFCLDYEGKMYADLITLPFVFSDESRFCDCPDSHRVWVQKGTYSYSALAPTNKFPKFTLMVWGAIGLGLKSELIFFEEGAVNSKQYLDAVRRFCDQADSTYGYRNWVFVQDGAP
jgi:transcriptional regulator with XRE-family HTH domain